MSTAKNHHYVPQWYQRSFREPGDQGLYYLDLRSETPPSSVRMRPIRKCFAEDDLYTLTTRDGSSVVVEERFFGPIDDQAAKSLSWWRSSFEPGTYAESHIWSFLRHLSTQKLRTPKGLGLLERSVRPRSRNELLGAMTQLQQLFMATWSECVWQLVDAVESPTKFIVTDHPVTIYNRRCGPRHEACRGFNDPDVRMHGSHTLFPLGPERLLVLTNKSWVLNPYQNPTALRPNPVLLRSSMFNMFDVHVGRSFTEDEVRQTNFILKARAHRYIAAAQREWLYPEDYVSKSDWADFGNGYLFMPDPHFTHEGEAFIIGYADGSTVAYDAFGRRPGDLHFAALTRAQGQRALYKFRGEFREMFGEGSRGQPLLETFRTPPDGGGS